MKKVMVDVDGIMFPFTRAFSHALGHPFEENDCPAWQVYPQEFSREELREAMKYAHSKEAILKFGLFDDVVSEMEKWQEQGIEIIICTRRHFAFVHTTRHALRELGVPFASYHAAPGINKVKFCLENEVDLLIDDRPKTIEEALEKGVPIASLSWAYNQHLAGVHFASSWTDLGPMVTKLLA